MEATENDKGKMGQDGVKMDDGSWFILQHI